MEKLDKVIAGLESHRWKCDCTDCPYNNLRKSIECTEALYADALRILKLWDALHKDLWDRTHEIVRLKKELKSVRAERDAALEKLSWLELKPAPNDWGEYPPEFPREGM